MRNRVLFHCPACEDDRLGEPCHGRAGWRRWLRSGAAAAHLSCVGCRRMFTISDVDRAPVGTSERARLNRAVRAMAAAMVAAGTGDPRTTTAALEFVRSCTMLTHEHADLRADLAGPRLEARVRGELTLLATDLSPRGAEQLLAQFRSVLDTGARITTDQHDLVQACAEHLGLDHRPLPSAADDLRVEAGGRRSRRPRRKR